MWCRASDEGSLTALFAPYGELCEILIIKDKATGDSKGPSPPFDRLSSLPPSPLLPPGARQRAFFDLAVGYREPVQLVLSLVKCREQCACTRRGGGFKDGALVAGAGKPPLPMLV